MDGVSAASSVCEWSATGDRLSLALLLMVNAASLFRTVEALLSLELAASDSRIDAFSLSDATQHKRMEVGRGAFTARRHQITGSTLREFVQCRKKCTDSASPVYVFGIKVQVAKRGGGLLKIAALALALSA